MTRDEEVQKRIKEWEERNHKKLEECTRLEWVNAMREIMCLTQQEAEEYLDYLASKQYE